MEVFIEELSELYAASQLASRRSCPNQRFIFPTSPAGSVCGPPAVQQIDNSATGKSALRKASPLFANADVGGELASHVAHDTFTYRKLLARLKALGHRRGATLFMTLLAGFKALLLLRTGRNDICVATTYGQSLIAGDGAHDRPVREYRAHPYPA